LRPETGIGREMTMTNIFGTPRKVTTRDKLIAAAERVLRRDGWAVERVGGTGKSSMRRISRNAESKLISIKTTQDQWVAFSRTPDDRAWSTLADVEAVAVSSVDNVDRPRNAQVHLVDAEELRARFDRAYKARLAAGRSIPVGRGVWLSLYEREDGSVTLVGAGVGLDVPQVAEPLDGVTSDEVRSEEETFSSDLKLPSEFDEPPLTILEAKRRLAIAFGVEPSAIRITVEG